VLLADVTTPDVRDLGLSVVRAVVPGSHPLFMGHALRARGGRRLWEVPQRLGHRGISPATGDNPAPHPYP
jgi:ribosomal protein S12 methylthiotransferase accessory factor